MSESCPFALLGLGTNTQSSEVERAWRKKSFEWHPDKRPGDKDAKARFQALTEARDILLDRIKRQATKAAATTKNEAKERRSGPVDVTAAAEFQNQARAEKKRQANESDKEEETKRRKADQTVSRSVFTCLACTKQIKVGDIIITSCKRCRHWVHYGCLPETGSCPWRPLQYPSIPHACQSPCCGIEGG